LLLPQLHKKSKEVEPPPSLETSEQIQLSLKVDHALGVRARRQQDEHNARAAEIANDRARFELTRDKFYFCFEAVVIAVLLVIAVLTWKAGQGGLSLAVLGGSAGFGGLVTLLHKRGGGQ
jgi:Na+/H+-translocating membrane pyrophosphatase